MKPLFNSAYKLCNLDRLICMVTIKRCNSSTLIYTLAPISKKRCQTTALFRWIVLKAYTFFFGDWTKMETFLRLNWFQRSFQFYSQMALSSTLHYFRLMAIDQHSQICTEHFGKYVVSCSVRSIIRYLKKIYVEKYITRHD